MFNKLLETIAKRRERKIFREYEFRRVNFELPSEGTVQYAQWLHPGEFGNVIKQENVDFYKSFVKPGDFAIDIGANEGDITVPMALAAGKAGMILAIEANPYVYKILVENSRLNKDKAVIIPANFAATAYDGDFTFGSGDASFGNGGIVGFTHNKPRNTRYQFTVPGKNLETYLPANFPSYLSKLTLIKIDTEGYDKEILKTLANTIKQYRPFLITECFGPSTTAEKVELFDLVAEFQYVLYRLSGHRLNDITPLTRPDMSKGKTFDILAIPAEKVSATGSFIQ